MKTPALLILQMFVGISGFGAVPGDEFWDVSLVGNSPNGPVWAVAVDGDDVYVGGKFSMVGSVPANNIARWDGTAWHPLGSGVSGPGGGTVNAIAVYKGRVYAGGGFTSAGGSEANNIAYWEGGSWNWMRGGLNGGVNVIEIDPFGKVYVGGSFSHAGVSITHFSPYVARWGSGVWDDFNGDFGSKRGLALTNDLLYAVGSGRYRLYNFSSSNPRWVDVPLGGGVERIKGDGTFVYELSDSFIFRRTSWMERTMIGTMDLNASAIAPDGDDVYIGGRFTEVDGVAANGLARFREGQWTPLGSGVESITNPKVTSIAASPSEVYIGGHFSSAGGNATPHFAIWRKPLPPAIVRHPQRRDVRAGKTAVFRVVAESFLPVEYQWQKDGEDIVDANEPTLVVTEVQSSDAGSYTVLVSNEVDTTPSAAAELSVESETDNAVNRVLQLGGGGDIVEIPHDAVLQNPTAFTIEGWVHPVRSNANKYGAFINKSDGLDGNSDRSYEFRWFLNQTMDLNLFFNVVEGQPGFATVNVNVASNAWTHVALTFSSEEGEINAYRNGALVHSLNSIGATTLQGRSVRQSAQPLILGVVPGFSDTHATGFMDEVRVWDHVRTAQQVSSNFARKLSGGESGLVGYWSFDDGGVDDFSALENHGIIHGDAGTEAVGANEIAESSGASTELVSVGVVEGLFKLGVRSPLGRTVSVEATTNWENWMPVGNVPDVTGRQLLNENVAPGFKAYRAKMD